MKKIKLFAVSVITAVSVVSFPAPATAFAASKQQAVEQRCDVKKASKDNCNKFQELLNRIRTNADRLNQKDCPVITSQDIQKLCASKTKKPKVQVPACPAPKKQLPESVVPEKPAPEKTEPEKEVPQTDGEANAERTFEKQVVELVNKERAARGLSSLTIDKTVESAALVRAKETEVLFSHTRPNGSSFVSALKEQGVNYMGAGENIAWGQRSPEQVMQGWMNSDGHRANILNPNFTKIGVGYYQNSQGINYWTQLFTY